MKMPPIVCFILLFHFIVEIAGDTLVVNRSLNETDFFSDKMQGNASSITDDALKNYHCLYLPGYRIPNRTTELRCCNYTTRRFYSRWYNGRAYLTTFLDKLKDWECPQLVKQCKYRFFDFTPFTNLVYKRVCEPQNYRKSCFEKVSTLAKYSTQVQANNLSSKTWRNMVYNLQSMNMMDEDIDDPCTQVALYEGGRGGLGRYHESIAVAIPFCGFVWCGYDADTVYGRKISVWRCMPQGCRIGIGIATAIIALLGLTAVIANITVVAVYWYKKRLNNSQVVYKVTLAFGDMLVGVVVFPTFISSFFMLYMTQEYMGRHLKPIENETLNGVELQPRRAPSGNFGRSFPESYVNAVGFFTSLSIIISVYTLMIASFDRMAAVCRPMAYDRRKALYASKYVSAILGFVGLIVATLPIYTRNLRYGLVASILISLSGKDALILYSVMFVLPLILVWISTLTLYVFSKKYTHVRRRLSTTSSEQVASAERRLAKTLIIMVGVFTLSILPAVITLLLSLGLSDIYYQYPEKLSTSSATAYVTTEFIVIVILTTNSLWNCFIYGSRDKDFGSTVKALLSATSEKLGVSSVWRSTKHHNVPRKRRLTAASAASTTFSSKGSARSDQSRKEIPRHAAKDEISKSINGSKSQSRNSFDVNDDSTWRSYAVDVKPSEMYADVMDKFDGTSKMATSVDRQANVKNA